MKHTLKVGFTALVIAAVTMSGIALAQTDEATDEAAQNAVTRIAEKLQALVDDGTITADQANAVAETLAEGFKPGGRQGPGHRANPGAIAEFLGMEMDAFREALQEYDTLADLAAANGSSGTEVIDYLVGQAEEHLAEAVADGKFDQAEADEKLAQATERITEMVNSDIPEPGEGGPRGRRGPGGPGGEGAEGGFGGQPQFEGQGVSA
jgi:polyhydroxyalkanoate synthesis regulator phasin